MNTAFILSRRCCRRLLVPAVLPLLFACSESQDVVPPEQQTLVEVVGTQAVTMQEIVDFLYKDYGISPEQQAAFEQELAPMRMVACDLTAHTVHYRTTAPDGSAVVASGVVYYPKRSIPRGVLEIMPINKSKCDCVSRSLHTAEALVACLGYVCIIPDLIGCGASDALPITYMQHENSARVAADLRRAAAELISKHYGRQLPSSSIIGGYSLGGSISWALARHYALHPELGVTVKEVWCGGGAYDPVVAINAFTAKPYSEYAILPNIIFSMDYYDQLGLDFSKVFRGELLQHYREWCTGELPIWELTPRLGYDMEAYLCMDFFSPGNPDYQKLMQVVTSKAIPNDWKPTARVHLAHSREDTYVPRECGDQLYAYLKSVGANVDYTLMEEDHVLGGLVWGQTLIKELGSRIIIP